MTVSFTDRELVELVNEFVECKEVDDNLSLENMKSEFEDYLINEEFSLYTDADINLTEHQRKLINHIFQNKIDELAVETACYADLSELIDGYGVELVRKIFVENF